MMKPQAVIVGASHAGAQLAVSLRQEGWEGEIVVIGNEAGLPYHRPPLSKTFLSGEKTAEALWIRPAAFYEKNNIQFRHGEVIDLDRAGKKLTLHDGTTLMYDKLALCVGAQVRKIDLLGGTLKGVQYLRTLADAEALKAQLSPNAKHAVIIGGGYIGLEIAAALRQQGMQVVVLEMADRILQRVTAPEISTFYARLHAEAGVTIRSNVQISHLVGDTQVRGVVCSDGLEWPADMVVVGVGVLPNVALAQAAGITVDQGILVDEYCRSNDPDIVAAGDCTQYFSERYQRMIRLESVPNAMEQAKIAAATLCGGNKKYASLPWFWSDQYDVKLQIAGLNQGYDQLVIRGDQHTGHSFAVFYFYQHKLLAADCVNRPQEFMLSKKILAENLSIDPLRLADEQIPVKLLI